MTDRCTCRVCTIAQCVFDRYGAAAAEDWINHGYCQEEAMLDGDITKAEYEAIYTDKYIDEYMKEVGFERTKD